MGKFLAGFWTAWILYMIMGLFFNNNDDYINTYIDSGNGMMKNIGEISILVDSKIVDVLENETDNFVKVVYENDVEFYVETKDDPFYSYSKLTYTDDNFDMKEYLMILSNEYLSDSVIDILKTEGHYEYKKDGVDVFLDYKNGEINVLEAKYEFDY